MSPYHIALADDHVLVRQGLKSILEKNPELEVVGEANDGLDLLNLLRKVIPQLVILDISMPNLRGIEAIHEIKRIHPDIKIMILTMHRDKSYLHEAISAGADGYLLKEDADIELAAAIKTIQRGKIYVSPLLSPDLTYEWAQMRRGASIPSLEPETLTTREREVLKMIADGKSSQEIADLLFISVRTVGHHRANILGKLQIKNVADLVKYAIKKGYV